MGLLKSCEIGMERQHVIYLTHFLSQLEHLERTVECKISESSILSQLEIGKDFFSFPSIVNVQLCSTGEWCCRVCIAVLGVLIWLIEYQGMPRTVDIRAESCVEISQLMGSSF